MTLARAIPFVALAAALALAVTAGGSCYSPAVDDCQYSCAQGRCPEGLQCNEQRRCVVNVETTCGPMPDDGGPPDTPTDSDIGDAFDNMDSGGPGDVMPPPPDS